MYDSIELNKITTALHNRDQTYSLLWRLGRRARIQNDSRRVIKTSLADWPIYFSHILSKFGVGYPNFSPPYRLPHWIFGPCGGNSSISWNQGLRSHQEMKRRRYPGGGRGGRSDLVLRTFLLSSLSQGEVFLYDINVDWSIYVYVSIYLHALLYPLDDRVV